MNFKEQSIPLLAINEDTQQFAITNEGKQFLCSLDKPLSIVTIAGLYRTGKSYLVNKLIKAKTGFKTGGTTKSVTKGLNVWGKPILATNRQGQEMYYIVIDSEGIGSFEQEIKYDYKLLLLIFLISSTVVYNSVGAIDELSLDQLRVILNLKECIGRKAKMEMQKVKFVWVLRDFSLQLIDKYGRELTSNEYLQNCLQQVPTSSLEGKRKNEIRKAIKQNLGDRTCFTLVRPTLKEQDLADLSKCKPRKQFTSEIQLIYEEVFSGNQADIKVIQGKRVNGNLFYKLFEQYVHHINDSSTPNVVNIWDSVLKIANQEFLESCCAKLKKQVDMLVLPMSKDELKYKLNQIQNKIYSFFEKNAGFDTTYRGIHKQFLKFVQKVNKDIKKENTDLNKSIVMKQIRQFVKSNLPLQKVSPTNLTQIKILIQRLQLRSKGQIEGYEYILSTLFDVMHVVEQKSLFLHKEMEELRKTLEYFSIQRKNGDLNAISIKQDYHQALKMISLLKNNQEQLQKENALLKNQQQMNETMKKQKFQQFSSKEMHLLKQIEEINSRNKVRFEQLNQTIKKLREQNNNLSSELELIKQNQFKQPKNQRKEIIFAEKINETWEKFDEERKYYRKEIEKSKNQIQNLTQKNSELTKNYEKQIQKIKKQRQIFANQQKQFINQLKQIKSLQMETKKTYCATFDTIKENDRILKSIQNAASNTKMNTSYKKINHTDENYDQKLIKKFYESQIQKNKSEYEQEINYLNEQLSKANQLYSAEHQKSEFLSQQMKNYQSKCSQMQKQLMSTSQKFIQSLSEIQNAKQRQRSLYEESIVRLLTNLQKRQVSNSGLRGYY